MEWDIVYMYEIINRKDDTIKDFVLRKGDKK